MMHDIPKILLIEDDPILSLFFRKYLSEGEYDLIQLGRKERLSDIKAAVEPNIILLDLNVHDNDSLKLVRECQRHYKNSTLVVVASETALDAAMMAVNLGAYDYLVKPITKERFLTTIQNALRQFEMNQKLDQYSKDAASSSAANAGQSLTGHSIIVKRLEQKLRQAGGNTDPVLLQGEKGAGKMFCAEIIHQSSATRYGLFMPEDCRTLDEISLLRDIFGVIENDEYTEGKIAKAAGGTLFLNGAGFLPLSVQEKLLQFIKTKRFIPIGGAKEKYADTRIICATSHNLVEEVREGRFLEALFYAMDTQVIKVPSLQERVEDIEPLCESFYNQAVQGMTGGSAFLQIEEKALNAMQAYKWPGNLLELKTIIEELITDKKADGNIKLSDLPVDIAQQEQVQKNGVKRQNMKDEEALFSGEKIIPLHKLERMAIEHALEVCGDNVQKAAYHLQISPATLYRKKPSKN